MKRGKPLERRTPCFVRWWLAELEPYQEILPAPVKITTCYGPVQVDHIGPRAKGQRSADEHTMAVCKRHHQERTDYRGPFKDWNAEMMRTWCDWAIRVTTREISDME